LAKCNRETVATVLKEHGIAFGVHEIEHGVQFRLEGGTPLDLYEASGKLVVRGKASDEKALVDETLQEAEVRQIEVTFQSCLNLPASII
jgi:hypothetical protein